MLSTLLEISWKHVPEQAVKLAEESRDGAERIQEAIAGLPRDGVLDVRYRASDDSAQINIGDWTDKEEKETWTRAVERAVTGPVEILDEAGPPSDGYVKVALQSPAVLYFHKQAASQPIHRLAQYLGYLPGRLPGAPSPLVAAISSGLLGAGLGYGGGKLVETFLPETRSWGLAPRLALWGGLLGTVPAGIWALVNKGEGLPANSGELMEGEPLVSPKPPRTREVHLEDFLEKGSSFGFGQLGGHPDYTFDAEEFNETVWEDPRVSNRLSTPTQAAATGLVTGAAHLSGSPRLVSPLDMAKVTAGMGSGYVSGAIIGKALGALMGMPQSVQDKLKRTGVWAGVVANLTPLAFGG